jgi:AcrR family transcriptional regulator
MKKRVTKPSEKIQGAALALFIKKGIAGTTTKAIAKKAGVSEGTIYNYFKSKEELAYRLFVRYMDEFRDELTEKTAGAGDPVGKLSAAVGAFFGYAEREPRAYAYIMIAHYTELKKMPYDRKKPKDVFVEIVKEGIDGGIFINMDKNLGAAFIIGMVTRAILFHKSGIIVMPYSSLADETSTSCLRALGVS